ncbi:TlpA disulfide reductase family protein [uncultured Duncaniella sp.]|uniref:TlpA family protein disulfide reductase n=1 Tax=uncultured Duncaniella sp. TaxID=2768039 RepID=UPI00266FC7A6|nr:TlpA disulfide reductase family protein [uncultured Duncaniella sp.]
MKKILTTIALFAIVGELSVLAAEGFSIKGFIPNVTDSVRIVIKNAENIDETEILAKGMTADGHFLLTGNVKYPVLSRISFSKHNRKSGRNMIVTEVEMMLENADYKVDARVHADSLGKSYEPEKNFSIAGAAAQSEFDEYMDVVGDIRLRAKLAGYEHASKYFESNDNPDTMAVYDALRDAADAELIAAKHKFIREHPSYHISSSLVFQEMRNLFMYTSPQLDEMFQTVKICPDTARVNALERRLHSASKYVLMQPYKDFSVNNVNGEEKRLSDFVIPGKYTFIDFWASWCGPCRSAIPHVAKLRDRYGDRMNVCSVSVDEEESAWRKAMEEENMAWTQLHLTPGQLKDAVQGYFITTIPRLILLDDSGRIVCSTNLPRIIDAYLEKNLK